MNATLKLVGPLTPDRSGDVAQVGIALGQLRTYFAPFPAPPQTLTKYNYSGGQFELLASKSESRIDPSDLVAVTALSVTIPANAAIQILGPLRAEIIELLGAIKTDVDLVDATDPMIAEESEAGRLYWILRDIPGLGRTKVSKLIALKRPRLVPIYDDVVGRALGVEKGPFWVPLRETLGTEGYGPEGQRLHDYLERLRTMAGISESISAIRVLDVIQWMTSARKAFQEMQPKDVEQLLRQNP